MNAAQLVADLIDRRGISKSRLAAESGVSRSSIDDYLAGRQQPSLAQLERLGRACGARLTTQWVDGATPAWARPHPTMAAPPLTLDERAEVLQRVVDLAMALPRRQRGELEFPPFRSLAPHARA